MLQLALTIIIYLLIVIPVGRYMYHIAAGKHTFADPVFDRVDGLQRRQSPKGYELETVRACPRGNKRRYGIHRISHFTHSAHWTI